MRYNIPRALREIRNASEYLGVAQFGSVLEWGSRGRKFESSHSDQQKVLYSQWIQDFFFFRFCVQIIDAVCNGCVIEIIYRKAVSQTDSAPSPPSRTRCRRRQRADPAGRRHDPDQAAINDPRPRSDMVRGRLRFDASRKDRSMPDKKLNFMKFFRHLQHSTRFCSVLC